MSIHFSKQGPEMESQIRGGQRSPDRQLLQRAAEWPLHIQDVRSRLRDGAVLVREDAKHATPDNDVCRSARFDLDRRPDIEWIGRHMGQIQMRAEVLTQADDPKL